MNRIAQFVKEHRKAAGLTQEEFAMRSGLGLRFVRELPCLIMRRCRAERMKADGNIQNCVCVCEKYICRTAL